MGDYDGHSMSADCFGGFKMMFMISILGMMIPIPDGHMLQAGCHHQVFGLVPSMEM